MVARSFTNPIKMDIGFPHREHRTEKNRTPHSKNDRLKKKTSGGGEKSCGSKIWRYKKTALDELYKTEVLVSIIIKTQNLSIYYNDFLRTCKKTSRCRISIKG